MVGSAVGVKSAEGGGRTVQSMVEAAGLRSMEARGAVVRKDCIKGTVRPGEGTGRVLVRVDRERVAVVWGLWLLVGSQGREKGERGVLCCG